MMDLVNASIIDAANIEETVMEVHPVEADDLKRKVDELFVKVEQMEQRVDEVEQFYSNTTAKKPNTSRNTSIVKEKEKHIPGMKKLQLDASRREATAAKRMQDLIRQFGSIFRQITQHKLAWPFMHPVDVEGLKLRDYYKIIDRPMDFSTIKNQMEAKDGTGYKHIREICSDLRLVFNNALKYNDEQSDVHYMARKLLEFFEEKWLQFLPKVTLEEEKRKQEEAEAEASLQLAEEAAHAKMARDLNIELYDIDMHIEELRDMVVKKCRHISTMEKRKLGVALSKLSPEDLNKALEIVAQSNLNFQANSEEVELDIDAQSESTLWRLKFFVKDILKNQPKSSSKEKDGNNQNSDNNVVSKRKREICDAIAKTAKKQKQKTKPEAAYTTGDIT